MTFNGYGVCTWTFGDLPLAEIANRVARLGYDGVELLGDVERYTSIEASRILVDHGLRVFSMTPVNIDLAHPDDTTRKQAIDYYFRLLDYAAHVGSPLISCHGAVGRIRADTSWQREWDWMVESVRVIAERAQTLSLRVALELLNRYDSHLLNNAEQALRFIDQVGLTNVGVHLDAYHMNIEEPNPVGAIRAAGRRLLLFHAADSNREGIGRSHTNFSALFNSLREINYGGPVIMECTAPGPDPFQAIKDEASVTWVETYLRESLPRLRSLALS